MCTKLNWVGSKRSYNYGCSVFKRATIKRINPYELRPPRKGELRSLMARNFLRTRMMGSMIGYFSTKFLMCWQHLMPRWTPGPFFWKS